MEQPYVLLVTAAEFAEIIKFNELGLTGDQLAKATGEIVSIPWEEFTHPLYCKIDARAPGLRFAYHEPQAVRPPDAGPSAPPAVSPAPPSPHPLLPPARVSIAIEYDDLSPSEAHNLLLVHGR